MKRYASLIVHHPALILGALALITLVALQGIVDLRSGTPRLRVDPAIDRLLPEGDEERAFYERARKLFGGDEFVLLVLEADDVFQPESLERLQRVTARLAREPYVQRVLSLANATHIEGRGEDVYVGPFFEAVPSDPAEIARVREQVLSHPIYGRSLVSRDARAASVVVVFERMSDREFVARNLSDHVAAVAREEAGGARVHVTGSPHVKLRLTRSIVGEMRLILPAVVAIAVLLCAVVFRTVRGVVLPLAAIAMALVWTLGAMGWSGSPLTLVSNIVPPLIITLGFASAMHVVSEYYELLRHAPALDRAANSALVRRLLQEMGLAIAVNGFTTVLGFLSLCLSSVGAIRDFGVWAVVGSVASTLTSLTLIPALLVLLGPAPLRRTAEREGAIDRFAEQLAEVVITHRRWVLIGALLLLVVSLAGMTRIRISSGFVSSFSGRSEVRQAFDKVNAKLGGVSALYVVVDGGEEDAFRDPANLRVLRELQDWLEKQPEVGGSASLADAVMLLHRAFLGNDPAAFSIPERGRLVKQLLLFGGDEVSRGFVDSSYHTANITVRLRVSESADVSRFLERLEEHLATLPQRLRARATGDIVLLTRTMDGIARGQLESIGTALITIYLTLAFLLTSFRVGLYALLPNLLPIAIYYGTLGLTGVTLNLSTSLIGAITLGIAVDDTVHYFARFGLEARRLGDERRATASTLRSVIRPVTATTIGLCLGFLSLTMSELRGQVQFGLLSAFTIAVAWVLELTLSPALCSRVRLVTLWDLLTIDLGPNPQRSIPLFKGLSERQSRIFALMSRVFAMPKGQRLFSEGERGDDMYVVIEGELGAYIQRGTQTLELARMQRGDVVGEIALFWKSRTANVEVLEDARLLRFGEADLERLGRRYPRIAARVYRNLSEVIAGRVITTTQALR